MLTNSVLPLRHFSVDIGTTIENKIEFFKYIVAGSSVLRVPGKLQFELYMAAQQNCHGVPIFGQVK